MKHELPPLPYAKDALQPYMSAETLEYHHGKHHKTYVDTLNKLIEGTEYQDMALEDIIRKSEGKIFNNAAQVWNHTFFWKCMGPGCGGEPSGELAEALRKSFTHFGEFKRQFSEAAINQFGTGWAWLVKKADGSLAARASEDADNPLTTNETPLLTLDVWEHAYYIDYRNERPKFVEAFWSIVNWDFVNANFVGKR